MFFSLIFYKFVFFIILYIIGSLRFIFGDFISIFARKTHSPSLKYPFFMFSNKKRFSFIDLFLYGLSIPFEKGFFYPITDINLKHSHEGSIGNLCNNKLKFIMKKLIKSFNFEKVNKAINNLLIKL